jgi:hypothetical protein
MHAAAHRFKATTAHLALAFTCLCAPACPQAAQTMHDPTTRTISGTITDTNHEPLRGAIVELENPASHQIVSYLTQDDGRYQFKRLDSHTDFQLWATFRGHKSPTRSISMFDSHLNKVINIVCKTF